MNAYVSKSWPSHINRIMRYYRLPWIHLQIGILRLYHISIQSHRVLTTETETNENLQTVIQSRKYCPPIRVESNWAYSCRLETRKTFCQTNGTKVALQEKRTKWIYDELSINLREWWENKIVKIVKTFNNQHKLQVPENINYLRPGRSNQFKSFQIPEFHSTVCWTWNMFCTLKQFTSYHKMTKMQE